MIKEKLKKAYAIIPFKKPIFNLVKKLGTPSHEIYKHLYFKGKFQVQVDKGNSFQIMHYGYEIENELFWKGLKNGWEKVSIGLWIQLCRNAKVIFDVGANTGVYSLVAKTISPAASVFAFEPVARVFEKLSKNCSLNQYDIKCYQKAVSNYTGEAVIYDTTDDHILSVTVNKNLQAPSKEVRECKIETITLKQFVQEQALDRIDLMKIDVETHEPEVLEGFGEYLNKFKPTMLIEILNEEIGTKVNALVEGMDYLYFNIDENNGVRQVDRITHSDYYNYLLCSKEVAKKLKLL